MNGNCEVCPYKTSRERLDLLSDVRYKHNSRFCHDPYLKGLAYFSGWSQISTLTNRCFVTGGKSLASLNDSDRQKAVEFAQKVSDLFYEYTTHKVKENKDEQQPESQGVHSA